MDRSPSVAVWMRTARGWGRSGSQVAPAPEAFDVVHVGMGPGRNVLRRTPDHLAVFQDLLAPADIPHGELVAIGDVLPDRDLAGFVLPPRQRLLPAAQVPQRRGDIVHLPDDDRVFLHRAKSLPVGGCCGPGTPAAGC